MKVKCTMANEKCVKCPHSIEHKPHKAHQTDWDGKKPCVEEDYCELVDNYCRCIPCPK